MDDRFCRHALVREVQMTLQLDTITRKKLALVKQLYLRAVRTSAHASMVDIAMSVIGFDLATETALRALISSQQQDPGEAHFPQLITNCDEILAAAQLDEVPDKVHIKQVHTVRNDAQHRA